MKVKNNIMANITDLTGYTWKANDTITLDMLTNTYNLNFICDNTEYTQFKTENVIDDIIYNRILYGDTQVYEDFENTWADEKYKTIKITGGTDATNSWLIENIIEPNGTLTKGGTKNIKLGTDTVKMCLGDTEVDKIYLGTELVYEK